MPFLEQKQERIEGTLVCCSNSKHICQSGNLEDCNDASVRLIREGWETITTKTSKEHDPKDCTGSGTAPSPHRRFHMPRYSITKRHMEDGFPPLGFRKIGGRLGWGCPEGETKAGGKGGEIFALVVIGGRHKKSSIEINCLNFSWNYIYSSSFILSF